MESLVWGTPVGRQAFLFCQRGNFKGPWGGENTAGVVKNGKFSDTLFIKIAYLRWESYRHCTLHLFPSICFFLNTFHLSWNYVVFFFPDKSTI